MRLSTTLSVVFLNHCVCFMLLCPPDTGCLIITRELSFLKKKENYQRHNSQLIGIPKENR